MLEVKSLEFYIRIEAKGIDYFRRAPCVAYFLLVRYFMHNKVLCTWNKCYFKIIIRVPVLLGKNRLLGFQALFMQINDVKLIAYFSKPCEKSSRIKNMLCMHRCVKI